MKAVMLASQSIQMGIRNVIIAGGMESMSNVPHYSYMRKATSYGDAKLIDGIARDGLVDAYNNKPMGFCNEKTNKDLNLSRLEIDEYCKRSYKLAVESNKVKRYSDEIVPVEVQGRNGTVTILKDEEPPKYDEGKVSKLKPAFDKDGKNTPANSSKISDGACTLVLMEEGFAKGNGFESLARIVSYEDAEVEPIDFTISPGKCVSALLKRVGLTVADIDYFEINEAFSSVVLANVKLLGIDLSKVNLRGGAVSLGHPIGMSGARIILSLVSVLKEKNWRYGIASICNGGGGSSAILVENIKSI